MGVSRRQFLGVSAGFAAALAASGTRSLAPLAGDKKKLSDVFKDTTFTDQYGKSIDVAALYKDKPVIVMFGYGGCQKCKVITKTVTAIQQKLLAEGKDVAIAVVSVNPEQDVFADKDYNPMKVWAGSYYENNVVQFKGEKGGSEEAGSALYDADKEKPQKDRILHLLHADDKASPGTLHDRLELIHNREQPLQHSAFYVLFDQGVEAARERLLDRNQQAPDEFVEKASQECLAHVNALSKGRAR